MAIATAESLEAEEPKKKRGRPKGSGKKSVQPEPEPEPEPKPEPPSNKGDNDKMEAVKDIDWKSDDGIVLTCGGHFMSGDIPEIRGEERAPKVINRAKTGGVRGD
ncbi:hypothetical protein B0H10DRAFT_2244807 [Mycena sp. CBHHK59/15]|nr:hypothetical protein B0H10DRAFT_2244807 [Mycena sp. CBHHK59/15]